MLRKLKNKIRSHKSKVPSLPKVVLSSENQHIFFGYYDLNPFDSRNERVLALRTDRELVSPKPGRVAEVGYFDLRENNPKFMVIDKTECWNWQQGCRLLWYPKGNDYAILYNSMVEGKYGAIIQQVATGEVQQQINHPVYDLDPSGKWGLSLNFSRLHRLRPGYGYGVLSDTSADVLCPDDDGVWLVDIEKNERQLLFSLAQLATIAPQESMKNAQHYINHLCFNPSATEYMFFHLWMDEKNVRRSRLFVSSFKNPAPRLLKHTGNVSHYTWQNDEKLLITAKVSKTELRYCLYDIHLGFEEIVGNRLLVSDGHPTYISNGRALITDTYPDKNCEQTLLYLDIAKEQIVTLERFFSPKAFRREVRCDLHPRISTSENRVCVDMVHRDRRAMCVLDISSI